MRQAITRLLKDFNQGEATALDKLLPEIYDHLHRLAAAYMRKENPRHTLQPTALVNEAFIRLFKGSKVDWQDRNHFFVVAASLMRRILVDHAKAKKAAKRGGPQLQVTLKDNIEQNSSQDPNVVALDRALSKLEKDNARQARIVEMRYFAGMSIEEVAMALQISEATVKRDWVAAKEWLYHELST